MSYQVELMKSSKERFKHHVT